MSLWTILYNQRYRTSRKPEPEPELDHSDLRRSRHHRRRRRHSDDRYPHPRFPCHRTVRTELEPVQLEHTHNESREAIGNNGGVATSEGSRLRLISSNRLPGVVEQARARLLERLRGSSLSGRRETPVGPVVVDDDFTVTESGEREAETERQWSELVTLYGDLTIQMDQAPPFHDVIGRKTPLCHAAQSRLQREVFTNSEECVELVRESLECCICLEKFHEGDELILLHCAHRFHPACLEPWIMTNGNCPYCRASTMC